MSTCQMVKTGTWSESFPKQQVTEFQSALFVKKLLAIAMSNVAYLRVVFPEHAFGDRCLEDMNLKILKNDKSCPAAAQMIQWLKGVFDALDKKYLRVLILGIYTNPADPNTFIEAYTFKFAYNNNTEMEIYRNNKKISNTVSGEETKKATIALLRSLLVLAQTLKPLPEKFHITMKLFYYDDVTPEDYEPPGFQAAMTDLVSFEGNPMKIRVGNVATSFHTLQLRLTTDDPVLGTDDTSGGEHVAMSSLQGLDVEPYDSQTQQTPVAVQSSKHEGQSQQVPLNQDDVDASQVDHVESDEQAAAEPPVNSVSPMNVVPEQQTNVVQCPCAANEDDGMMIQCSVCRNWQHAVCFNILDVADVPKKHVCHLCYDKSGVKPVDVTDSGLSDLSAAEAQMTCLWRRALTACMELDSVTVRMLLVRLGVKKPAAESLMQRLVNEGFVSSANGTKSKTSKMQVMKNKLLTIGKANYLSRQSTAAKVNKIVRQASDLQLSPAKTTRQQETAKRRTSSQPRNTVANVVDTKKFQSKPTTAMTTTTTNAAPPAAAAAASKKVYLINSNYEFGLSNTQEDFESQQPRRKRFKASDVRPEL